jgi:hypothetical protein
MILTKRAPVYIDDSSHACMSGGESCGAPNRSTLDKSKLAGMLNCPFTHGTKPPPPPEAPLPLESSIYDSILKDRPKLAGTHDTASGSYTGTTPDPPSPIFNSEEIITCN